MLSGQYQYNIGSQIGELPKGYVTEVKGRIEDLLVFVSAQAAESDCLLGNCDERAIGAARRVVSTGERKGKYDQTFIDRNNA